MSLSLLPACFAGTISIAGDSTGPAILESSDSTFAVRSAGQTFAVPFPTSENILTSFGFTFDATADPTVDYRAYIFAWDSTNFQPVGSALFTSDARKTSQAPTFSGLNLVLVPGTAYIAFLTTQGAGNDTVGFGALRSSSSDAYANGDAYIQFSDISNGNTGAGTWKTDTWFGQGGDLQFSATFVPVPEPSTLGVLGTALGSLVLLRRRFRS